MEIRRITSNLPADLLAKAQETTGLGITETLVTALEALLQRASFERMKKLQGKIHLQEDGGRKNGFSGK